MKARFLRYRQLPLVLYRRKRRSQRPLSHECGTVLVTQHTLFTSSRVHLVERRGDLGQPPRLGVLARLHLRDALSDESPRWFVGPRLRKCDCQSHKRAVQAPPEGLRVRTTGRMRERCGSSVPKTVSSAETTILSLPIQTLMVRCVGHAVLGFFEARHSHLIFFQHAYWCHLLGSGRVVFVTRLLPYSTPAVSIKHKPTALATLVSVHL